VTGEERGMSIRREVETLLGELLPYREERERQVRAEWARRHARGEEVREGDASRALLLRWWDSGLGEQRANILVRRGLMQPPRAEDEE
jgi:hypothetical protein